MKKVHFILAILCCSVVLGQQIKGKVKNMSKDTNFSLRTITEKTIKEIKVDNEGNFDTGNIEIKEGYYILRKNNELVYLYLKKEDNLNIQFDAADLIQSVVFSGKGAEINTYLIDKRKLYINRKKDTKKFYEGDENDYLKKITQLNNDIRKMLLDSNLDKQFTEKETINLEYGFLLEVFNYKNLQKFYFGKEVTPSEAFLSPLKGVDFDAETLYNDYPSYKNLTSSRWKKVIEKANNFDDMDAIFRSIKTRALKVDVLISFYYAIAKDPLKAENYYQLIKKYVRNEAFLKDAKKKLASVTTTVKGKKSPNFSFENIDGNKVQLKDFKGKYVFIDVWATWCLPCLQQIPYLKKLEERFEGKNIVFVGISVDRKDKYSLWKETIEAKKMKGIQLFADKSFESDFIVAYGIMSIPRFILIDPEGKIVDSHMTKPSEKQTEETLKGLLK
ncbi:cytochrome c biogenesis protein CcmG, thiol:disulfide interchange protein DsbE [Tenacibaculum sp. 190524A02b]|uniref:Cytochrome c biogenesis protein CcmG, thiol:disulfide interchange protein DsbE n=1 Tax=Tenacibaculum vairaonense TaxID=3137860 RepID=A0ABM9PQ32_9FLAO